MSRQSERSRMINSKMIHSKKLALAASSVLVAAGAAHAGTITFSGRTWDTYDAVATSQYNPGQSNSYATVDNNTGSMTGRFGIDTIIKTAMTVNAGDKVSYDYVLTNENRDFGNDGASQWIGDNYASFRPSNDFYPSSKVTGHTGYYWYRDLWFSDPFDGNWTNAGSNNNSTGVHFEWSFPTSTTYQVNVWNGIGNTSGTPVASFSSSLNGDVSTIQAFRLSLWDSEQTASVSNFKSRPTVPAQSGNTRNWIALSSSNYNGGGNWLEGSAPTMADHATIANGGTAIVNGSGANAAHVVTLAIGGATGNGTVEVQSGGELFSANSIRLGTSTGTGTLNQTGGLVAIDMAGDQNLRIGHDAGGTGIYNLSGGELWVGDSLTIGKDGNGTLNMTGGWISHAGFITVGRTAGSSGVFNMSGGVVDQSFGDLEIGNFSTGTANFSGGTFNGAPGRALAVGNRPGGTGTATISGTALVKTEDLFIAGNDNTDPNLGGNGTLNINGGELQVNDDFIIGNYGNGTLTMTGGLVSKSGWIVVGNNPGSSGTFNLSGGTINQTFGDLEVGDEGAGVFNQSGGTINISNGLYTSKQAGGNGVANISGGTLNTTFTVNNGAINSTGGVANLGPVGGTGSITVGGTGVVNSPRIRIPVLNINGGDVNIDANGGADGLSVIDNLSISAGGGLDLRDNDLVVNNGNFATIRGLVLSGFGTGDDIHSSTSDGSQILALFDNALVGAGDWQGVPIGPNAIVGKYTFFGDANFDGQVTGDDYTIVDSNLNTTPPAGLEWLSGDMNLDGIVTGDDYTTIDSNLGLGVGNPLVASALGGATAVPEPASIGLLAIGGIGMISRRRRRFLS